MCHSVAILDKQDAIQVTFGISIDHIVIDDWIAAFVALYFDLH